MWFYFGFYYFKGASTEGQKTSIVTDYILKVTSAWSVKVPQQLYPIYQLFEVTSLQVLGLEVCADTIVGDQMVRGISGGQKKRVTTGKLNWKHKFT